MEFKEISLGELCEIKSSKRIYAKEYQNSGIPFYRSKEIIQKANNEDVSTELYISEERYKEIKEKFGLPTKGDILLTSVGTLGVAYLVENEEFYFKDGNLTWFSNFSNRLNNEFLYYWFNSQIGKNEINRITIGSTQKALTIVNLKTLKINLPTIENQIKIVSILKSLNEKLKNNLSIIVNLENISQSLFKQWFIDFEFPNEEGKPYKSSGGEMVESELGEIPKGWVSSNISEVCLLNKGSYSKKDEWSFINYLDTSSITNNSISNIQLIDVQKEKVPSRAKRKLLPNDIVYSTVRPNQYHYGLIKNPLTNMVASTGFTVIRSKGKYPNGLIYMWLTQKEVTQHLQSVAEQSTSAYPSIKADDIGKIKILIPPKKLIDTLNDIISNNHNQIWGYQQENKKLSELRDTLLPKLLSGEIEIPAELEV